MGAVVYLINIVLMADSWGIVGLNMVGAGSVKENTHALFQWVYGDPRVCCMRVLVWALICLVVLLLILFLITFLLNFVSYLGCVDFPQRYRYTLIYFQNLYLLAGLQTSFNVAFDRIKTQ